ncbi:MAG TPA: hypothetical protein VG672_15995, partial [Bryobacteraceae bacterium]|nr:hypothetical protein [Bryobacteraceae bacterium]
GKTDILVRSGGENVLVAECKFWSGEIPLLGAIDQVLSYLSWRDTRAALVVFQRQGRFSLVLDRIEATVPQHACFRRLISRVDETTFRYEFRNPQDAERAVVLTVLAFDLPSVERGRAAGKLETREKRAAALVELLVARGGSLNYNEMASELQMPREEAIDLVNRQLRGSGLLRKVRRGGQIAVALRSRKRGVDRVSTRPDESGAT